MGAIFRLLKAKPMEKPLRVSLCIGHSRWIKGRRDGGAISVDGTSEWNYNCGLVEDIKDALESRGALVSVVDYYEGEDYFHAMQDAAKMVKLFRADCALELHFNSSESSAGGHEWLHLSTSTEGTMLAGAIDGAFKDKLPKLKNRGLKPLYKGNNGYWFVQLTPCPAVVCEPFFGSSNADWDIALDCKKKIAQAIADGIIRWNETRS